MAGPQRSWSAWWRPSPSLLASARLERGYDFEIADAGLLAARALHEWFDAAGKPGTMSGHMADWTVSHRTSAGRRAAGQRQ